MQYALSANFTKSEFFLQKLHKEEAMARGQARGSPAIRATGPFFTVAQPLGDDYNGVALDFLCNRPVSFSLALVGDKPCLFFVGPFVKNFI